MADTSNLSQFLADIADSIRSKTGTTDSIPASEFDIQIENISTVNNQTKTATPSTTEVSVEPDDGYTGLDKVTVSAVDRSIDSNIVSENIVEGVTILGVEGTATGTEINNQDKTVIENSTVTADEGYTGLGTVTVDVDFTSFDEYDTALATAEEILGGSSNPYATPAPFEGLFTMWSSSGVYAREGYNISEALQTYFIPIILSFITQSDTSTDYMFYNCKALTSLDLSDLDMSNTTTMQYMFGYCTGLTKLDLSDFDTSNVTNMNYMFYHCQALTSLDVSSFDTSNVINMNSIFRECNSLTNLDVSNFDTSSVTNMSSMFYGCDALTNLDLSLLNTSNVTNMSYMFFRCTSLITLDLSNFDTSNSPNTNYMFAYCTSLTTLDISSFDWTNTTGYAFSNCTALETVYVKDETSKTNCDTALSNVGLSITSTIKS